MYHHPWLPNLSQLDEMLKEIGVKDVDELFKDVPQEIRIKDGYRSLPQRAMSEFEILNELSASFRKNLNLKYPPFLGGGICPHYIPYAVKMIMSRSEFYTSYTPYQQEISQGLLQALFEYQSLIAELFELEVVNASLYDWGSALAEAVLMSHRINGKKVVLVPSSMNPFRKEVLRTWIYGKGLKIVEVPINNESGETSLEEYKNILNKHKDEVTAVYMEQPNFYGVVETQLDEIFTEAKKYKAITILGMNPLFSAVIKPPGEYGVDIAVSDGQEIGLALNYGGPLLGIIATRWDSTLIKQLPGRIVGLTKDVEENRAYTLILQYREQFSRREKATSNITTNETLMAIGVAVYLSLLGKNGLITLAEEILRRSHYAVRELEKIGVRKAFSGEFLEEVALEFGKDYTEIHKHLLTKGIHGGLQLDKTKALYCFSEVHTKHAIDELIDSIREVMK